MEKQAYSIAFLNKKGGVGKTTSTISVGAALAVKGFRVVILDIDSQASLTQGLYGPQAAEDISPHQTVAALFDDAFCGDPHGLVRETPHKNLYLVPGTMHLERFNVPEPQNAGPLLTTLREFVREIRSDGQIVLFDCPPTLNLLSWAALIASDFVVVPLIPEDYGSQGITHVQRIVDLILARYNNDLRLLGYMLTMVQKRLGVHVAYERQIRDIYPDQVFLNTIPMAKHFKEAVAARIPLAYYAPRSAAAKAIASLTNELLERAAFLASAPPEFLYLGNRVGPQEVLKVA